MKKYKVDITVFVVANSEEDAKHKALVDVYYPSHVSPQRAEIVVEKEYPPKRKQISFHNNI